MTSSSTPPDETLDRNAPDRQINNGLGIEATAHCRFHLASTSSIAIESGPSIIAARELLLPN